MEQVFSNSAWQRYLLDLAGELVARGRPIYTENESRQPNRLQLPRRINRLLLPLASGDSGIDGCLGVVRMLWTDDPRRSTYCDVEPGILPETLRAVL